MKDNVLRLNGLAKLLRPTTIFEILALVLFMLFLAQRRGFDPIYILSYSCALIFLYPLFSLLGFTRSTRKIQLDKGVMHFTCWQVLENPGGSGEGFIRTRGFTPKAKVKYTVTDIENLKFEQNKLEKLFNCGHFSFEGNTVYETDSDRVVPKTSFTFYGLTHFRQTKKEICNTLGTNETE
jgi:hypothetical protein